MENNIISSSKVVLVVLIVSMMVSSVYAKHGTATFYTSPYVPSACYGYQDDGVKIGAASDAIWNKGAACGRHYKVTCTGATNKGPHPCKGGSIIIKIVDYCPNCHGTIDLSEEAFSTIANTDAGKIKIRFDRH